MSKILVDVILSRRAGIAITFDQGSSVSGVTTCNQSITTAGVATCGTLSGSGSGITGVARQGKHIALISTGTFT